MEAFSAVNTFLVLIAVERQVLCEVTFSCERFPALLTDVNNGVAGFHDRRQDSRLTAVFEAQTKVRATLGLKVKHLTTAGT